VSFSEVQGLVMISETLQISLWDTPAFTASIGVDKENQFPHRYREFTVPGNQPLEVFLFANELIFD